MRGLLVVAAGAAIAIAACGIGLEGSSADAPDASIVASSDAASPPRDAGSDVVTDAGPRLAAPDPGSVACVGGACATTGVSARRCCVQNQTQSCVSYLSTCAGSEIDCDERGDCGSGNVCCLGPDQGYPSFASAVCAFGSSCGTYAMVCKTDAECPSGKCIAISCAGRVFGTCGGVTPSICR